MIDLGVCGASEACITYGAMRSWQAMRVLSPEGSSRSPSGATARCWREGAGILVLEDWEHAKARGATPIAELKGFGMTSDAADMVNPSIEGPTVAMQLALADAGLGPGDIDYINAHGTATTVNDINETARHPRACSARPPRRCRSPRPSPCTAIAWARAAAWRRLPASRPCRTISCPPPSASTSRARAATSTTRPTRAARAR